MNIRRVEYFLTLAKSQNLHHASEILHISPPALSKAMKLLEEELGVTLWVRSGRKMILSDAGKSFVKELTKWMEDLGEIRKKIDIGSKEKSQIRIATFEVFSTYFLRFLDLVGWQEYKIELHDVLPGSLEKYVAEGLVDYGITYMPIPHPDLDFLKITSIEMGVFIKEGSFKDIPQNELPFVIPVMPIEGVPTRIRGLDGWPDNAYHRKITHKVTMMESALELCRQGKVAGYFPVFIADEHNNRVKKEFRLERKRSPYSGRLCKVDVFLVKRKSDEENIHTKQLAKGIRLICGG
jgi:DNA-binding transcriptional LysR family regulator